MLIINAAIYCGALYVIKLLVTWLLRPYLDWKHVDSSDIKTRILDSTYEDSSFVNTILKNHCVDWPELTIVIPAFNEESRLECGLQPALDYCHNKHSENPLFTYEFIIVDDGSSDSTSKIACQLRSKDPNVNVITLRKNSGKGFATMIGMRAGRGRRLLMMDADGATCFKDLDNLQKHMSDGQVQVALGSRRQSSDGVERTWLRWIMMQLYHGLVTVFINKEIKDTQCGFKLFARQAARELFLSLHVHRWAFDIELIYLCSKFGFHINEIPVHWQEIPGSKLNPLTASFEMVRDLLLIPLLYTMGIWKKKSFSLSKEKSEADYGFLMRAC